VTRTEWQVTIDNATSTEVHIFPTKASAILFSKRNMTPVFGEGGVEGLMAPLMRKVVRHVHEKVKKP